MKAILLASLLALGCGSVTPALVQCKVAAVQQLPLNDPDAITVGDVKALVASLKACAGTADAGTK